MRAARISSCYQSAKIAGFHTVRTCRKVLSCCHVQVAWKVWQNHIHQLFMERLSQLPVQVIWKQYTPAHFGGATGAETRQAACEHLFRITLASRCYTGHIAGTLDMPSDCVLQQCRGDICEDDKPTTQGFSCHCRMQSSGSRPLIMSMSSTLACCAQH
jgi:hypothetical protein